MQLLGPEYGSKVCVKSTVPGEHLFVGAFRDLKAKVLVAIWSTTTNGSTQHFRDPIIKGLVEVVRLKVFDQYETSKSR
jgi:hypothetical protein